MPPPIRNFAGLTFAGVIPPDTNGDVGFTHYIQAVNDHVAGPHRKRESFALDVMLSVAA
jgi:hypothetical protein